MKKDLTQGNITKTMLVFAGPMIVGNLLQQCYNIVDMLIVGKVLGAGALAAVGAAYTLMTFLTSMLIGMCMGSGTVFSFYFGQENHRKLREGITSSFLFIGVITVAMNVLVFVLIDIILRLLKIPVDIQQMTREYVWVIFLGIFFIFLYNFFAFLLRAVGNSVIPLLFLGISSVLNIFLDILFVLVFELGIAGAAWATVVSQIVSGVGIALYTWVKEPSLRLSMGLQTIRKSRDSLGEIMHFSIAASVQQSVMNFGILMIQGLVNSFGTAVMAAFAAAVKIDSFAYMPAQEFANAFCIFISQNRGAGKQQRVDKGVRSAIITSVLFCVGVSVAVVLLARYLMLIFVQPSEVEIIRIGVEYLRIEGSFYLGIGILMLWYGYYRAIGKPEMSVVLTVISLGTRVLLAYILAPIKLIGVYGIWWAIPIGWFLADVTGYLYLRWNQKK
ncbi:MATE family efflux transporter [Faecalicatena contorta]|uniref:MATE family efflux transporter n=1 Tax=Faecalicatena contorta TaxID=39482 RepID=UPI001F3EF2AE|nr:MATE family efflux transporter [Faecalicatena contorta]MCF2682540.1 MATE family efflux transporter [Faecalicatena contorta]